MSALLAGSLVAVAMVSSATPALAAAGKDAKSDTQYADLDIKAFGFSGKKAYIEVYGNAGETHGDDVPFVDDDGHGSAIAYVITIRTDTNEVQNWAIDSHEAQHGDSGVGVDWHGHRVHLGDNPDTTDVEPANCVNEVDQVVHATMKNKKAIFEDMKVRGNSGELENVNAVEILSAQTVLLDVEVADPDNPPAGTLCLALVADTFDTAN
ncbi:hypothetical protein [Candidatus Nitrososphaera sp. FF02]|uniref:hypothetical protein n=1 Tax=Candidatus Nitrososphaera sp. FF02 TaxID=3398226 RepID=UPI0039E9131B